MTPEDYFQIMKRLMNLYPEKDIVLSNVITRFVYEDGEKTLKQKYTVHVLDSFRKEFYSEAELLSFVDEIGRQSTVVVGEKKPRWNS